MNKLSTLMLFSLLCFPLFAIEASIKRGAKVYNTMCIACHGQKLEGGTGFNLKDSEWIHGSKPNEILETIKKGFPDKGMVAFGTVLKDNQITDLVNFILSKQEGLRNLKYEIYHGLTTKTKMEKIKWDKLKAAKTGTVNPPYVDYNIPEVDAWGMTFKGQLLVPESGQFTLTGKLRQNSHFQILINGKPLRLAIKNKKFTTKIKFTKGNHRFESRYVKNDKYSQMNLNLRNAKFDIPLSMTSFREQRDLKYIVNAVKEPLILRKKILGLPAKSIAVAYPEKINYAFNPINGSINALWYGEFLNIAPNIYNRGKEPSLPLGKYIFNGVKGIHLLVNGKAPEAEYRKYSTLNGVAFTYAADGKEVTVESTVQGQAIVFTFKTELSGQISFQIPSGCNVTSKDGTPENGILKIKPTANKSFSITVSK